jgi:hypothetical protein
MPAVQPSRSAGLVTLGRAIRLGTSKGGDKVQATAMLRTAASQTPSLARDIDDILKRWER